MTAFSRHTFNPRLNLKVRFIGEPAVDVGGPKRELFRLFFLALGSTGDVFQDTPRGILPTHNVAALAQKIYEVCGKILAIGIIHGSQNPMCFTREVAHFLVHGSQLELSESDMIEGIPDVINQDKIRQVCTYIHSN